MTTTPSTMVRSTLGRFLAELDDPKDKQAVQALIGDGTSTAGGTALIQSIETSDMLERLDDNARAAYADLKGSLIAEGSAPGSVEYVLSCPEKGVFVGHCMGFAFWSRLDAVDQPAVPTCPTFSAARELMLQLGEDPSKIRIRPVFDLALSGEARLTELEASFIPQHEIDLLAEVGVPTREAEGPAL